MNALAQLERIVDAVLGAPPPAAAVVVDASCRKGATTRFADSQIHQNTWNEDWHVAVRAVLDDGRAGIAVGHSDDPADAARLRERAVGIARLALPDPDFPGAAGPSESRSGWSDASTAAAGPAERAEAVRTIVDTARPFAASGSVVTVSRERVLGTSEGADLHAADTRAKFTLVLTGPRSTGFAEDGSHAFAEIDPAAVTRRAAAKVHAGRDPAPVAPGLWPVILEPSAVASLVQYLGYLGFGAKIVGEGRSFVSGRLGEAVLDPSITFVDDAADPQARGFPFDGEGTPKQRVVLVRDGVLEGVVHDRRTAAKARTTSTGHALPPPSVIGPIPLHPFLLPGDGGSVDDLVAASERALLVTRFHYVNVARPKETVLTGMTRDGTFLVEEGRVVRSVRNLRFTQSLVDALSRVDAVATETGYGTEIRGLDTWVPAMALPAFRFTGETDFG